jgi:hypothetical protein
MNLVSNRLLVVGGATLFKEPDMKTLLALAVPCLLCCGGLTVAQAAEEKVEIKEKSDGSWKMKVKRKGDDWVGVYNDRTYVLRGDVVATTVREEGDYTVYGTIAPDNTYITTTKVTRVETR